MTAVLDRFRKWQRWIEAIDNDLSGIVTDQEIFHRLNVRVLRRNHEYLRTISAFTFLRFVQRCYLDHVMAGVRRQVKMHKDSISLRGLLQEIADDSQQLTFEFYESVHPARGPCGWQWRVFKSFGYGHRRVSRKLVERHINMIEAQGRTIETVVDRSIAHLDKREVPPMTYGQLRAAIRKLDHVACKYRLFLLGSAPSTLSPTFLEPWTRVFDNPLRPPTGYMERSRPRSLEPHRHGVPKT